MLDLGLETYLSNTCIRLLTKQYKYWDFKNLVSGHLFRDMDYFLKFQAKHTQKRKIRESDWPSTPHENLQ